MIGEMKHLLSRILKFKTKTQDDNTDLFVNVTFDCIDKPNECAKVSAATNLNKTKKHEYSREFVDSKCPHFNIAVILIVLLLAVVFVVVPLVYLLHCFDLLYTRWTTNEFTVFADHNRDSSHEQIHKHGIYVGKYRPENPAKETRSKSPILPRQRCTVVPDLEKFDCYPENGASENLCLKRGCCWYKEQTNTMKDTSSLGVPFCYYPKNYGGYQYLNISTASSGIIAFLERTFVSPYPNDASIIKLEVKYEQQQRLRIKVTDPNNVRFEPPYPEVPIVDHEKWPGSADYSVNIDKTKLGFQIIRKSDGLLIFDAMDVGGLVFADQFLQLSARLPSHRVYGLGEHTSPLQLSTNWTRFTMMNHDQIPSEDTNLYGSHPFYLVMEDSGKSHGVFLLNSNAMDVILQPTPAITFRTIGGVLDFFFFLGPSPADVVRQYTDVIGKPFMPPFWGLGFHLCRYGYKTINRTIEVWNRTRNAGIPLDVQWNDLDYMQHANDFTLNTTTFGGLPEFVQHLHKLGMHYIPLIDAGVSAGEERGSYPPYDEGLKLGIFVKNSSGLPVVGKVWNSVSTVWPDFTHPRTVVYWLDQLTAMHNLFPFDGAWIDMNEPSNFLSGTARGCDNTSLDYPPYTPGVLGGELFYRTLCMSHDQYAGKHYDVHNLYGFTNAIVTSFVLSQIRGKRPFVISRSTFSGHGHYAGHWSGDVVSSWSDMKKSIPQLLNFNMFGVPLMGADICGFNQNTTAPLCQRWMELGAFYPFARNHNTDDGIEQDPVALGPEVVAASRKALLTRYSLLPYLYTLFWEAHVKGNTVARPLFFEFSEDKITYDIDYEFLWGSSLLIVPVLEEAKTMVTAYLPRALWYDFYSSELLSRGGQNITLDAPLDTIPLLVRGGGIIPMQEPAMTTTDTRKNKFRLLAAVDETNSATGLLYWDDGDSLNSYEDHSYNLLSFTLANSTLVGAPMYWGYNTELVLGDLTVLGIDEQVWSVHVNNASAEFLYNSISKSLFIGNLSLSLNQLFTIEWQ
ncbi:lysosomal alpha-glucosidase-like [Bacillus rossius redtenbacheri]|uniref:lysosomal alpha-glucosidase-like n=1 Tax=Bacillus rossius redtenbacheri TaxID=93214 RepID=UPI002FDCC91B